jgi:hypothetical protein
LDVLNIAANASGIPPHLLGKDIWVVWSLQRLFASPYAKHLVFKGGYFFVKSLPRHKALLSRCGGIGSYLDLVLNKKRKI